MGSHGKFLCTLGFNQHLGHFYSLCFHLTFIIFNSLLYKSVFAICRKVYGVSTKLVGTIWMLLLLLELAL